MALNVETTQPQQPESKASGAWPERFELDRTLTPDDLHEMAMLNKKVNVRIRLARAASIIVMAMVFLVLLTLLPSHPLSKIVGAGVLSMYLIYFTTIFCIFASGSRSGRNLHRIYSVSAVPDGWAAMSISSHQLLYRNKAIQSISEFSAIDGGVANTMLATLSAYTWSILVMLLATYSAWTCDFKFDAADIAEIVGIAGLLFIGLFELDPDNATMKACHYLGAVLGTGTIIGYLIQQWSIGEKFWLSVLIAAIAAIAFCVWQISNWRTEAFQKEHASVSREEVHTIQEQLTRYSLKNVASEAIFLFCGALSTSLWIWDYDRNCPMGCKGPFTEQCNLCDTWWDANC